MKLDVFIDAGSLKGKFGIGVLMYCDGEEIFKLAEFIDPELKVSDSNNAELYAISVALKELYASKVTGLEIMIHTDSMTALSAACGSRFKSCIDRIYNGVAAQKGQVSKTLKNNLSFAKIESEFNHEHAHNIAKDAASKKEYRIGDIAKGVDFVRQASLKQQHVSEVVEQKEIAVTEDVEVYKYNDIDMLSLFKKAEDQYKNMHVSLKINSECLMDMKLDLRSLKENARVLIDEKRSLATMNLQKSDAVEELQSKDNLLIQELGQQNKIISKQQIDIENFSSRLEHLKKKITNSKYRAELEINFLKKQIEKSQYEVLALGSSVNRKELSKAGQQKWN